MGRRPTKTAAALGLLLASMATTAATPAAPAVPRFQLPLRRPTRAAPLSMWEARAWRIRRRVLRRVVGAPRLLTGVGCVHGGCHEPAGGSYVCGHPASPTSYDMSGHYAVRSCEPAALGIRLGIMRWVVAGR